MGLSVQAEIICSNIECWTEVCRASWKRLPLENIMPWNLNNVRCKEEFLLCSEKEQLFSSFSKWWALILCVCVLRNLWVSIYLCQFAIENTEIAKPFLRQKNYIVKTWRAILMRLNSFSNNYLIAIELYHQNISAEFNLD